MAAKEYVGIVGRQGARIVKGQVLKNASQSRIKMLLDHGLIEEKKASSVSEKSPSPSGAGNEVAKKK